MLHNPKQTPDQQQESHASPEILHALLGLHSIVQGFNYTNDVLPRQNLTVIDDLRRSRPVADGGFDHPFCPGKPTLNAILALNAGHSADG